MPSSIKFLLKFSLPNEEEPRLVLAVDPEQLPAVVQWCLSQMLCLPNEEEPKLVLAVDPELSAGCCSVVPIPNALPT